MKKTRIVAIVALTAALFGSAPAVAAPGGATVNGMPCCKQAI